ncbi:MAG: hypothetical protein UW79_C0032G0006 [Candidatus Yanofskybacteria bacterium GW2011_GWA2_44_9]|nr:MAG: hypothetical protein UW79_C0032G0006 [Candidatus Yanofskybacteria bacterium GW2011_GWA2_44_9]
MAKPLVILQHLRPRNRSSEAIIHKGIYGPRLAGVKGKILVKIYAVP